jgi:colanic acid/amylovoran biosynthesis protein
MMGIVLISKLKEEFEDLEIYVDARTDINIERLKQFTNMEKIFYNTNYDEFEKKEFKDGKGITIVLGGDDMSEHSYKKSYRGLERILNRVYEKTKNNNVFLVGQTIGPFTEDRIELAKKCLGDTKIYTRDDISFKYLKDLNFENIFKGRDLAFTELPMQLEANKILKKYNIETGKYITVIISGSNNLYTSNEKNYINQYVHILENLCNKNKIKDKKIVLLPHVTTPGSQSDDRIAIRKVMNEINESLKHRIVQIDDTMYPTQARAILGSGIFSISGRMHGAVSSFYMRKPTIAISYSVKYAGVIGEGLDMYDLIVESSKDEIWENGEVSKIVDKKVDYILNNYEKLVEKIDKNVTNATSIIEEQLDDLVKEIKKLNI